MHACCGKSWPKFVLLGLAGVAVAGLVVMGLWNWLAPDLFGWKEIHFLQAIGLLALSRLLFGGFHGRPGMSHWRTRMEERWEGMSPEEREKFQTGMRSCWGRGRAANPPAKE